MQLGCAAEPGRKRDHAREEVTVREPDRERIGGAIRETGERHVRSIDGKPVERPLEGAVEKRDVGPDLVLEDVPCVRPRVDREHEDTRFVCERTNHLRLSGVAASGDEEGERRSVESADVNEYLKRVSGAEFTAKDFRTWAGTVLTAHALDAAPSLDAKTTAKKNVVAAIRDVSARLGNTPSVCRRCYAHPEVFEAYFEGTLAMTSRMQDKEKLRRELPLLSSEEATVVMLLRERLGFVRMAPCRATNDGPSTDLSDGTAST